MLPQIRVGEINALLTRPDYRDYLLRLVQLPHTALSQVRLVDGNFVPGSVLGQHERTPRPRIERPGSRAAVIINPSKFPKGTADVRGAVEEAFANHAWQPPTWFETTIADPGKGQALAAVDQGFDLVCPLGGDGTVRAVASGMSGSDVSLGLLPGGTTNLLARNLGLPVFNLNEALDIAITGEDSVMEVGVLRTDKDEHYQFLVMGGVGLDGDVMASVDPGLKERVGWAAYLMAGLQQFRRGPFSAHLTFEGCDSLDASVRCLLFGNVGGLTLGIELFRDINPQDGRLDALLVAPTNAAEWAIAAHQIAWSRQGEPGSDAVISERSFADLAVELDQPQHAQVDGDYIGLVRTLEISVLPQALAVRT